MTTRTICNEAVINCSPEQVYDYVTQPWRWHEWHPSSVSAEAAVPVLHEGDTFDEVICLRPLSPLPPSMLRQTHYRVVTAQRPLAFEVQGETDDGGLRIRYDLSAHGNSATQFRRQLVYHVSGPVRLIEPLLLYPRMKHLSAVALANLKQSLES